MEEESSRFLMVSSVSILIRIEIYLRSFFVLIGSSCIELGAQWIHGRKGNPVYELAKSIDLIDNKTKSEIN